METEISSKLQEAFLTIQHRAEINSIINEEDYFIAAVENGIAFFSETSYNELLEKTLTGLRSYLEAQNIDKETIDQEVDQYAANLVLHYIDHKSFSPEVIAEVKEKYAEVTVPEEDLDIKKEDEDETRL